MMIKGKWEIFCFVLSFEVRRLTPVKIQKPQSELNLRILATRHDLNFIPLVAPLGLPRGDFSSVFATRCPYMCAGKSALS